MAVTIEELETRLAQLEGRIGVAPLANPPIAIGELSDVPAPGSPIAAQWAQEVSARIFHRFPTAAARAAAFPAPAKGTASYLSTGDASEGPEWFDGVAWRKPWHMPWGLVATGFDFASVTTNVGAESLLQLSSTFAAPGGRRYRILSDFTGYGSVTGDLFRLNVRRGNSTAGVGVKTGPAWHQVGPNGYMNPFTTIAYDVPPANPTQQYMIGVARMSGSGAFTFAGSTYSNAIFVDDIGPAAAVAPSSRPGDEGDQVEPL